MPSRDLPIYELESAVLAQLRAANRLILQAPTGSGKSTQVPQMLLDGGLLGKGECVVMQPRRLPTRMLAARVASERGMRLGGEVGYQIRLDRITSAETRIRYVTEGILLRQMLADPELRGVSAILFDEFHERHLYGDITLARALDLQETKRPDLRVVVMSATLDTVHLDEYLAPCATLTSSGRMFPVEIEYLEKPAKPDEYPVWNLATDELDRLASRTEGDVLIFMPGAYEISRTVSAVQSLRHNFVVLPLHGELPPDQQDAAVARYDRRKVVVSTNVAETSLTIDGVRLVIDCGLAKIARFDPHRGINTLLTERISRASADQRAGRAGRTAPGRCLRLWTEREHRERAAQELPEVKRLDLAEVVLTLKASGVRDVAAFRWLEAPEPRALERAETLLMDLGALTISHQPPNARHPERSEASAASETQSRDLADNAEREMTANALGDLRGPSTPLRSGRDDTRLDGCTEITPIGRRLLAFPVHPRYARMLLAAHDLGCVRQAALVAALTQGRAVLQRSAGKQMDELRSDLLGEQAESDFFILMRAFKFAENKNFNPQPCRQLGIHAGAAREAAALFEQFLRIAKDEGLDTEARPASDEAIQKCVLAGFSDQLAARLDRGTLRCALVHGRRGVLARESAVHHSTLLVASEIREQHVKGDLTTLLTLATAVSEDWLRELFPDDFAETDEAVFDPAQKRVVSRRARRFRDLVLSTETSDKFLPSDAAEILADKVLAGDAELAQWTPAVEQWIVRVNRLREWMPELELPPIDADARRAIVAEICHGASSFREIRERPVFNAVKSWLSRAKQGMVDKFAPERITLPSGRDWRITYDEKAAPSIAARIQQLYGLEGKLTICAGRVPLLIQVLAPNMRPVQVTQDLTTFWREMYPKLKIELQRKYPKHEWR